MAKRKKKQSLSRSTIIDVLVGVILLGLAGVIASFVLQSPTNRGLPTLPPVTNPVLSKVSPPKSGFLLGLSLSDTDLSGVINLQQKTDTNFRLVGTYVAWGNLQKPFNRAWAEEVLRFGSIPVITWEPWSPIGGFDRSEQLVDQPAFHLSEITKGRYDSYIHSFAHAVAAYRRPLMIRFAHEMNGNWYSWGSKFNTPAEYIAMWRHVHDIFQAEYASNVTWVWSPNQLYDEPSVPYSSQIAVFYPGDAYVDWVGMSGFNWAGSYKQNAWIDPDSLYTPTIHVLETFHKPIMISETASAESSSGSSKAEWVALLREYLTANPQVKGLMWFQAEDNGINWRIDSTPASLTAFKEAFGNTEKK